MNKEEIKEFLPHREPMLLVDEMEMIDETHSLGRYHVTGEEFFLKGHFPGNPVVPGVILCEMMGQACTLLLGDIVKGKTPMYAGLNNVRFKNAVHPGDTVETTAYISDRRGLVFFVAAEAKVNGKLACKGDLSFILIPNDQVEEKTHKN
ncbi:MAG: 3-hydroxyacyl-ACP dehydratase FabZ [Bacteroidales bacterium]|nr:3-hydroxyacyl-ACP dehydratase FabZ [Bacteroidales bacterium]